MASAELLLNVSYRDIPLYAPARLREADAAGGFLESESPMPVGTPLVLAPLDNPEARVAARVLQVVEACRAGGQTAGGRPGMRLVFEAGAERLAPYLHAVEGTAAGSAESTAATAREWAAHTTLPGFASPAEMATEPMPVPPVPAEEVAGETVELEAEYDPARPGLGDEEAVEEAGAPEEAGAAEGAGADEEAGEAAGAEAESADVEPRPEETTGAGGSKKRKSRGRGGRRKKR